MSEHGYVLIDRGVWDHEVFDSAEPFCERSAWLWLISEAAWKDQKRRMKGRKVEVKRGQLCHSVRFVADAWKWSPSRVYRFLHRLISEGMIRTGSETGLTVITVCNYDKFQVSRSEFETQSETVAEQTERKENRKKILKIAREHLEQLYDAAGQALKNPAGAMGLLTTTEPQRWVDQGCDWELDVLPTWRSIGERARPNTISSWNYGTQAVADAKARRLEPMPDGNPHGNGTGRKGVWEIIQEAKANERDNSIH